MTFENQQQNNNETTSKINTKNSPLEKWISQKIDISQKNDTKSENFTFFWNFHGATKPVEDGFHLLNDLPHKKPTSKRFSKKFKNLRLASKAKKSITPCSSAVKPSISGVVQNANLWMTKFEQKSDKIIKGCDYIQWKIENSSCFTSSIFDGLNSTNTTEKNMIFWEYEVHITCTNENKQYQQWSLVVNTIDFGVVDILFIKRFMPDTLMRKQWSLGMFKIYGSFFRLQKLGRIDWDFFTLLWLADILNSTITRYDYNIDFFGSPMLPREEIIRSLKFRDSTNYGYKDYELGSKSTGRSDGFNSDNSHSDSCFVRCYDKKSDTTKKHKELLYSDYMNYKQDIRRLEFEFNSKFCSARGKHTINNHNILLQQIWEYLWLEAKTGYFSKKYELHPDLKQLTQEQKILYCKRYISLTKNIARSYWREILAHLHQQALWEVFNLPIKKYGE